MYRLVIFDLDGTLADASVMVPNDARIFDDMREAVIELHSHGIALAVATMMPTASAAAIVSSWDVGSLFLTVRGADVPCTKGDLIRLCMLDVGAAPAETLMVGDSETDMIGAGRNGVGFVAAPGSGDFERWDSSAYRPSDGMALVRFVLGFHGSRCHNYITNPDSSACSRRPADSPRTTRVLSCCRRPTAKATTGAGPSSS